MSYWNLQSILMFIIFLHCVLPELTWKGRSPIKMEVVYFHPHKPTLAFKNRVFICLTVYLCKALFALSIKRNDGNLF